MVTTLEQCFVYFGMKNMISTDQMIFHKKIGTNSPNFEGKEFQIVRFL
jgi:hypothetical protein